MYKVMAAGVGFLILGMSTAALADEEMFSKNSRWMTGDWGGLRTEWLKKGYDIQLSYQPEMAFNLHGGITRSNVGRYTDQFNIGGALDLEKILGWNHASFTLQITERTGRDLANDRLIDPRQGIIGSDVQENFGRGQTWHLTRFYYQQAYFDNVLDVKLGRLPVGDDFDSTGCVYQNNAMCGGLAGHGSTIWYNSPIGQWGTRFKVNITPDVYAQVGAYEYNPTLLDRDAGFKLNTSGRTGMTYLGEVGWTPKLGPQGLPGRYFVGGFRNTANANDVLLDSNGMPKALSGNPAQVNDGRYAWYAYAKQKVTTVDGNNKRGLSLWAHYSTYDKDVSTIDWQAQIGAFFTGPLASRPQDEVGIGFSDMHVNPGLTKNQQLHNQGLVYDVSSFIPVQTAEYAAEIHYDYKPTPWLLLRPNLQYLGNPGGVNKVNGATILGLTVNTVF